MSGLFAHAGHWLVNLAYVAPLLLMVGVIAWGKLEERRTDPQTEPSAPGHA
jgi:hypothetical protein